MRSSHHPRLRSARRSVVLLSAFVLLASLFAFAGAQVAGAAACSKTYSASISNQDPDPWPAGSSGTFTLSFTNTATNCTSVSIGSIRISVPTGWSVTGASAAGWNVVSPLPVASGQSLDIAASGGTQKIAVGQTLNVSIAATSASDADGGTWSSVGWAATNFTSSQFATTDSPSVTVAPADFHLAFITQPATAEKNVHITSEAGKPDAVDADVQVGAFAGASLVTSFNGNIKLAIGTNPVTPVGILSPSSVISTGVAAEDGISTFSQLSIDKVGEGYTLVASADAFASSDPSDPFDIVDDYVDCVAESCLGNASTNGTSGLIDANAGDQSFLSVSILAAGIIDCAGYTEITGTVSWKTDATGDQIGTITADKSLVKTLRPPDQGAAHFQVCFRPDPGKGSFLGRSGEVIDPDHEGLLSDCSATITTNCVFFRNKTGSGSAVLEFRVADGKGRA